MHLRDSSLQFWAAQEVFCVINFFFSSHTKAQGELVATSAFSGTHWETVRCKEDGAELPSYWLDIFVRESSQVLIASSPEYFLFILRISMDSLIFASMIDKILWQSPCHGSITLDLRFLRGKLTKVVKNLPWCYQEDEWSDKHGRTLGLPKCGAVLAIKLCTYVNILNRNGQAISQRPNLAHLLTWSGCMLRIMFPFKMTLKSQKENDTSSHMKSRWNANIGVLL